MATSTVRRDWTPIINEARRVVNGYTYLITLRQLHYRLVMSSGLGYVNTEQDYKRLSSLTAEGRRDGTFPALLDQTRGIDQAPHWEDTADALNSIAQQYRRDRTEGQSNCIVLGGEKATLLAQLRQWFRPLGMPIVLLRGYGSQTYVDMVREMIENDGRDPVLIYAGDFDPSGEDILRDFLARCDIFDPADVEHIAIRPAQIAQFSLPVNPGKITDSRAAAFTARHGALVQVEVEALPPDDLRALYTAALNSVWDESAYDAVIADEVADKALLVAIQDSVNTGKLHLDGDGKLRKRR